MNRQDGTVPVLTLSSGSQTAAERRRLEAVAQMFRDLYAARVGAQATTRATGRHLRLVRDDLHACAVAPELRSLNARVRRSVG